MGKEVGAMQVTGPVVVMCVIQTDFLCISYTDIQCACNVGWC